MRFLGIDYGSKRVGIALSDEGAQFAMPLIVLKNSGNTADLANEVATLAKKNGVSEIILGESKNYKGEVNAVFKKSSEFKKALEERGIENGVSHFTVHFEPEFMTSAHAEKFQGKNELLDASAAALILQSFLDSDKNQNKGSR